MKKTLLGTFIGLAGMAALAISAPARAHVDVAVGVGVPAYYAPVQPVYVQPAVPVDYGYGYRHDRWREHEWRERREWRERQWRHEMHREERWHDRHGG